MIKLIRKILEKISYIKKKGTLVYVGLHKGSSFDDVFRKYKICYGFEANPELCVELQKRFSRYPNVHIFNAAVTDQDGEIDFNISNNDGSSSSVGHFREDWGGYKSGEFRMEKMIRIPSVNLMNFLEKLDVNYIDDYISDIQGLDLTVLKTIKPLIDNKCISTITCEVTKDKYGNMYKDIPDNSESGFIEILNDNYECVARGWHILKDGDFSGVPEHWWEMDCKWRVKE